MEIAIKTANDIRFIVAPEGARSHPIYTAFAQRAGVETFWYDDEADLDRVLERIKLRGAQSKEVIVLKKFLGRFFQKCPGSPRVICCNYRVINTCFNCLYDCSYCFLRGYLNAFGIVQFTNIDALLREVEQFMQNSSNEMVYRIGTGEFTDSLMFDQQTGIGEKLIRLAAPFEHIMLELKTKSSNVDHLLNIAPKGNAVLSWSLASERNIRRYERGTAALAERLQAVRKASDADFITAFHFDPVIIYDGWQEDYSSLIEALFEVANCERVAWISLGGFRYAPGFKDVLKNVEPDEDMTLEEMFPGIDGKYRYFKPIRIEMYKFLLDRIRKYASKPFIYLCMESRDVWHQVMGKNYSSSEDLESDFSDAMKLFLKTLT